jgi:hypothetical protein
LSQEEALYSVMLFLTYLGMIYVALTDFLVASESEVRKKLGFGMHGDLGVALSYWVILAVFGTNPFAAAEFVARDMCKFQ